jgi:hypothetical protein
LLYAYIKTGVSPCGTKTDSGILKKSIVWNILTKESGRPDGKRQLGRPRRRWDILKWIFKNWGGEVGTGLLWIRIGTGGGRLLMR